MSLIKKILTIVAPAMLLALGACTTGLPTQVSRFQVMPAPQGQSFVIQAADPRQRGGLEFGSYAEIVRRNLIAQGFAEASSPHDATLIVTFDYGVDNGRERIYSANFPAMRGLVDYLTENCCREAEVACTPARPALRARARRG